MRAETLGQETRVITEGVARRQNPAERRPAETAGIRGPRGNHRSSADAEKARLQG
jgi:hypothetical protein